MGHEATAPSQDSARSQSPLAARQTVPAFPAGCWQVTFEPSQRSSVQTLLSLVQAVPLDFLTSAGHVLLAPVHASARSHSPPAARQEVPEATKVQVAVQQAPAVPLEAPRSQISPVSRTPFPQRNPL